MAPWIRPWLEISWGSERKCLGALQGCPISLEGFSQTFMLAFQVGLSIEFSKYLNYDNMLQKQTSTGHYISSQTHNPPPPPPPSRPFSKRKSSLNRSKSHLQVHMLLQRRLFCKQVKSLRIFRGSCPTNQLKISVNQSYAEHKLIENWR